MYYFLLVLLLLDSLLLVTVVLLQAGKGGGLAAMGTAGAGTDSLFGSRQATTILTKATWWTGGIFLALAFTLSLLSGRSAQTDSILRTGVQAPAAPVTAPALPGGLTPVQEAPAPAAPADAQ
ncbi:MAG: preprotein translocase subunit SecG [Gemmatimonadota bacterium]|nr:preprotein translocase subunit SecG [Gemmatimonadota bacterium]